MAWASPLETRAAGLSAGWMRTAGFDMGFIVGIAVLALGAGWAVVHAPGLFWPILFADLWLLGYHHVISTYTRLAFDAESRHTHRFLILWLPLIVIAAVAALVLGVGVWVLATVYLYWQWFHYTRQSWGIAQVYRRKSEGRVTDSDWFAKAALYAVPMWGILHRSHQDPGTFLGMELRVLPVPALAVDVAAMAASAVVLVWIASRAWMTLRGRLPLAHTLYMLSHLAIFYVAYIGIRDITFGWLVVNIWHNAQYILFVWMYNNNRFKDGVDPKAKLLSSISQSRNTWLYFLVCFGLSTAVYLSIDGVFSALAVVPLVAVYQVINFHHYIVDSLIWKVRKKSLQRTLGLTAG